MGRLWQLAVLITLTWLACPGMSNAQTSTHVLVADRLGNRILAYNGDGTLSHTVVSGVTFSAGGMALSPQGNYLYASSATVGLYRFDFNNQTLTASNPVLVNGTFGSSTLASPAGIITNSSTVFVANRGQATGTVARLNLDITSQATNLTGGNTGGRSALAFDPNGLLLVGNFSNGAVLRYDIATGFVSNLLNAGASGGPVTAVASMLAAGNSLYVATGNSNGKLPK